MKQLLSYLWKIPLCGIAFFLGIALGGMILSKLGFQSPPMPEGTDANTITIWFLLGSMLLAFALSFVSQNLRANWFIRWIILLELIWIFAVVGIVLESFFFMTTGAISTPKNAWFTMLSFLLPALFLSLIVAIAFPPGPALGSWLWRIFAALLAYPLIYFTFGLLVNPLIQEYYALGQYELTLPAWTQLIPLQFVRSLFFLCVSLPVIIWWAGSRRKLWMSLGFSIFVLTAFMAVIAAYWFPWQLRLFHGMELLADGLVYAGTLVMLLAPQEIKQTVREAHSNAFSIKQANLPS